MAEIKKVIAFLEDDAQYLFKLADNPNYSDADRRKADDLYCDIKEAIQTIIELQERIPKWHKVELRPLTEEEKEEYGEDCDFIYDCDTPDDGQEVLVATKWGVDKTTFYTDYGCYFENYEDEGEVIAWMELPKFESEE